VMSLSLSIPGVYALLLSSLVMAVTCFVRIWTARRIGLTRLYSSETSDSRATQ
jgi:hypothetical protein